MKKHLDEVKRLQKIAGILKENVNQGQASNPKLHAFIKKVYAEIVDDFGGESPISLGQLANYIYDWMKINDLTPDQTIEEFNWRELTYELGLDTPPNVNEAPKSAEFNDATNPRKVDDDGEAGICPACREHCTFYPDAEGDLMSDCCGAEMD